MKQDIVIRPIGIEDLNLVRALIRRFWGDVLIVSRGLLHNADQLPGFVALIDNGVAGIVTYRLEGNQCEMVTLNSLVEGRGVASALIEAVASVARREKCRRLWLVTTNDNLRALSFYQKRGFTIRALYPNVMKEYRRLKPSIPDTGSDGIPLRDEIELELILG